jgi:hypothetical protein
MEARIMKPMRTKIIVLPALLLLILLSFGCSRRRDVFTKPKSPHPTGWNNEFSSDFHGIFVKRDGGPFECITCHSVSQTDSSSYCFNNCHYGPSGRPHPPAWTDSSTAGFHGIRVVNYGLNTVVNGRTRPCQDCHYVDNKDTLSWCFRGCHDGPVGANRPPRNPTLRGHREAWKTAANPRSLIFHGNYVASVGFAYCKDCHGSDFQGGIGPSCGKSGCHDFGSGYIFFPHQSYWKTDSSSQGFHGRFVLQKGKAICQDCHGKDFNGGYNGKPCYPCHEYPHPAPTFYDDTLQDNFHGMRVWRYGYDGCKVCHGDTSTQFNGGRSNVSCINPACHPGGLEETNRWKLKTPANRLWHGNVVGREGFATGCRTCHGANYDYNPIDHRPGCSYASPPCHQPPYPFKKWGISPHDTPRWASGDTLPPAGDTTHAWWVNVVRGRDSTDCSYCHYAPNHYWRDGTLVTTCQSCH